MGVWLHRTRFLAPEIARSLTYTPTIFHSLSNLTWKPRLHFRKQSRIAASGSKMAILFTRFLISSKILHVLFFGHTLLKRYRDESLHSSVGFVVSISSVKFKVMKCSVIIKDTFASFKDIDWSMKQNLVSSLNMCDLNATNPAAFICAILGN